MFAVGSDFRDGYACPAQVAGWSPNVGDESTEIAELYDYFAGPDERAVPEDEARGYWMEAIRDARDERRDHIAEMGEEIAKELGWL
jgi:hypothetical protein